MHTHQACQQLWIQRSSSYSHHQSASNCPNDHLLQVLLCSHEQQQTVLRNHEAQNLLISIKMNNEKNKSNMKKNNMEVNIADPRHRQQAHTERQSMDPTSPTRRHLLMNFQIRINMHISCNENLHHDEQCQPPISQNNL